MNETYDVFSKYYRELIYFSGHLEAEKEVINHIVKNYAKTDFSCKILDAACGTGDALLEILNQGYSNIAGLDGSKKMIERAKEILPNVMLFNIKWEKLPKMFSILGKYNLIFLISMSLPHAQSNDIPIILQSFYDMLHLGGMLVFDNRIWVKGENNILIEKDRAVCIFQNPRKINIKNKIFIVDDKCEYLNDRQYITYRIREEGVKDNELILPVDYAKISSGDFLSILSNTGFQKSYISLYPNWPYEIIYAVK